jgi:esterase/lipase superfamily enzyme
MNTGVEELHFIGHSMGNRILTRSLNQLIQKETFKNKINTIAQIILAAPDIDIDVFNKEIYPTFKTIGKRRTIYASDKDLALFVSEKIRKGLKRVGEAGTNIYVVDGMDTIDASNVMSKDFPHHSYMFEEKELLHDMNTLFVSGTDPKGRGLTDRTKKINDSSLKYWLFRE